MTHIKKIVKYCTPFAVVLFLFPSSALAVTPVGDVYSLGESGAISTEVLPNLGTSFVEGGWIHGVPSYSASDNGEDVFSMPFNDGAWSTPYGEDFTFLRNSSQFFNIFVMADGAHAFQLNYADIGLTSGDTDWHMYVGVTSENNGHPKHCLYIDGVQEACYNYNLYTPAPYNGQHQYFGYQSKLFTQWPLYFTGEVSSFGACSIDPNLDVDTTISDSIAAKYASGQGPCGTAAPAPDRSTHIVDFTPANGATVGSPTDFTFHAYISPGDVGTLLGIKITLHNIDHNIILSRISPDDIYLLDRVSATTSGDFYYATTTFISEGNYSVEASLEHTYLFGLTLNPLDILDKKLHQYHAFIVGHPTLIGTLQQNGFDDLQNALGVTVSSTSSVSSTTSGACNPLLGFNIQLCGAFLLTPDMGQMNTAFKAFYSGVLVKVPWGYFTRFAAIMGSTGTSSLPTIHVPVPMGGYDAEHVAYFDVSMSEMVDGAGNLLDNIRDPINHMTLQDILQPWVIRILALCLVFIMVTDLTLIDTSENLQEIRHKNRSDPNPKRLKI